MTRDPRAILHIGGPKCGSSALQAALSCTPNLVAPDGRRFHYVAAEAGLRGFRLASGEAVARQARRSPYGYMCWPNLPRADDPAARARFWAAFGRTLEQEGDSGPILSSEGWIGFPEEFAAKLAQLGYPRVTVVAFVRPPLEWLNAAYWQWGVWHGMSFERWHARSRMTYALGSQLARWARIPNIDLQIRASRPDVVRGFADVLGVEAPPQQQSNASGAPSLIGFLLRNHKRFRPTPHASANEFVIQRWCPSPPGAALWALSARDVRTLRAETRTEVETLVKLLPEHGAEALLADPRWLKEYPYHPQIRAGCTVLRTVEGLPDLYEALLIGLTRVSGALDQPVPDVPPPPAGGPQASIAAWDMAIAGVLKALLKCDSRWRGQNKPGLLNRMTRRLVPGGQRAGSSW